MCVEWNNFKLMSMVYMINLLKYCKNVIFFIFKSWGGVYKINNEIGFLLVLVK